MPVLLKTVLLLTASNVLLTFAWYAPFAVLYMKEPIKLDYLWAALCLCGAVYLFRR